MEEKEEIVMTAGEVLRKLRNLDVTIWANNGQLHCNGPIASLTPELRMALSENKAEILALLEADTPSHWQPQLQRTVREVELPLSFAQERLWFLDQFEPNSPLYNTPKAFRIRGPLKPAFLEESLNAIVRRHEVLRTTFVALDGEPVQRISQNLVIHLPVLDLSSRPPDEREEQARNIASDESRRTFDLASGPLIRAALVRLAADDHLLLVTLHHIVSDGWSVEVLYRELSVLYQSLYSGQPSLLPALSIQYADFARWQRQWLKGKNLEDQVRYWKNQLENITALQLPTDRPRPAVQRYLGARQAILLSDKLANGLKSLGQRARVTPFMTLLAAFKTLLYRYSGQEDIAVATPIAGRNRVEIEPLIGFFVNTLVLRSSASGNPAFTDLLQRVRNVALDAYSNQDLPFEKLVEELNPERNLAHAPLAQVMFAFQNFQTAALKLPGCSVEPVELDRETAKFDLTLQVSQEASGLRCVVAYNTDLFEKTTIARMLDHWQILLEGIVANPNRRISDLPLLTDRERSRLLIFNNDTQKEYARDECLHELIEEQAQRTPDALAVVLSSTDSGACENGTLTYREMNARANQLAHYLRKQGVGPETLVGILMGRSLEMVVALLGVLKAGAAYLPLDPTYPPERLAFTMADSAVTVVLTETRFLAIAADSARFFGRGESESGNEACYPTPTARCPETVCLDSDWTEVAKESEQNPQSEVTPQNLAYVIYTSGTTGKPKGVMIQHRSLVNYLIWVKDGLFSDRVDSLPVVTNLSFDASVKQLWAPLLRGHAVWLLPDDAVNDTAGLCGNIVNREKVAINCVPSLWEAMLQSAGGLFNGGASSGDAITLFVGGDRLAPELVERSFNTFPELQLWNLYGPTEATVNAASAKITRGNHVTIGHPIHNVEIYILDRYLNPLPIGVPGELYIGGDGLARGYLNSAELTAEKFVPHPFTEEPGLRLYKTGDRAHYLSDGSIEFLGRVDQQVKIRGFRIELGEIETVLKSHPVAREALVMARDDGDAQKQLVGYVVSSEPVQVVELRNFLRKKLPEYMIPSAFVFLDSLPLTRTGKVDRRALPLPEQSLQDRTQAFATARTPCESGIAQIWSEVLRLEQVGMNDNFFDLGGHSLLATRVMSRIRAVFDVALPLRVLFESPTVVELAARVSREQTNRVPPRELAAILADVESFSEDEAQALISRAARHKEV